MKTRAPFPVLALILASALPVGAQSFVKGVIPRTASNTAVPISGSGIKSAAGFWGGNISAGGALPVTARLPNGYSHGKLSDMLADVADVCAASGVVGYHVMVSLPFVVGNTAGDYTSDPNRGFPFWDQIRDALAACGKKLDVTVNDNSPSLDPSYLSDFFPGFTVQDTYVAPFGTFPQLGVHTCGSPCAYGISGMASDGSNWAPVWQANMTALKVAIQTAYCNRYDSDTTFVSFSMNYDSNLPTDSGHSSEQFPQILSWVQSARSACPHMNIRLGLTFWNPLNNTTSQQLIDALVASKADLRGTDVVPDMDYEDFGQRVFFGLRWNGSAWVASATDQRGVLRRSEEIESTEMCHRWFYTPAQFMTYLEGDPSGPVPPHLPNKIVVAMDTSCAAGYGWSDWKTFIAGRAGKLKSLDGILRTPAELNTNYCESGISPCLGL